MPGATTRYRFRVRTPDGDETTSDTFAGPGKPIPVHVILRDESGEVHAGVRYTVTGGGRKITGVTDAQGAVNATLPAGTESCELRAILQAGSPPSVFAISLAPPPPIDQIAGVQTRLNQAGFHCGDITGAMNDATKAAILELQQTLGIENPTGEMDDQTRAGLITLTEP